MSSETRLIRPFDVNERLIKLFKNTTLRFGKEVCYPNSSIIVDDPEVFRRSTAELELTSESDFERLKHDLRNGSTDSGWATSLLSLIIVARTSYLNLADIVKCYKLDTVESLPRKIKLTDNRRPRALQATTHGAQIDVYIILNQNIEPKALRASRKGTWLTHASFRIRTLADSVLFRPHPLDETTRREYDLGKNSTRFFELGEHDLAEPYNSTDAPKLYVDEQILAQLDANHSSDIAITMQRQLVIDFIAGVITEFAMNRDELSDFSYTDNQDSLIGRIAKLVASDYGGDYNPSQLVEQMKTCPAEVIARTESAIRHRINLLNRLKGT